MARPRVRFGFAFKANTGDTRESPAIYIAKLLLEEQAQLTIYDPKALENAKLDLAGYDNVTFCDDPYEAAAGAHAIAVVTEWKEFAGYDYQKLFSKMEKPAFLFDGRNILNHEELFRIGFEVYPLGCQELTHLQ